MPQDIFDRLKPDIFDTQVMHSSDMADLIREEIKNEIAKLPIGEMISKILSQQTKKQNESLTSLDQKLSDGLAKTKEDSQKRSAAIKSDIEEFMKKMREKYDEVKTELKQPQYQFGGFPLSGGGLPFANWRFRESGNELVVETYVSGAWVESAAFQRPA